MAEARPQSDPTDNPRLEDKFSCPICLDIYEKPMSISCGHSFCSKCLIPYNSQAEPLCPMCRLVFVPSIKQRNYVLEKQIASTKTNCDGCKKRLTLSKLRAHRASCAVNDQPLPSFKPVAATSQPVPSGLPNRSTFSCPYCGLRNLDCQSLLHHCNNNHKNCDKQAVCPICSSMPWGDPSQKSANFIAHLNLRHKFEYDTYVDFEYDDDMMLEMALKASLDEVF